MSLNSFTRKDKDKIIHSRKVLNLDAYTEHGSKAIYSLQAQLGQLGWIGYDFHTGIKLIRKKI